MLRKYLLLFTIVFLYALTVKALEPIVLDGSKILVDKSNLYELKDETNSKEKTIKKIPNLTFRDSIVMVFNLYNPTDDTFVIVELANPLLFYVKFTTINDTIITGRHDRNAKDKVETVNKFRNFRFKVYVKKEETLRVEITAKSVNFYQPMPVIIWNETYLSDAKDSLLLGITVGVLFWILIMIPILVYFSRIKIVLAGVLFVLVTILFVCYHLGFAYNLIFNLKVDTILHNMLIGLQVNVMLIMNWHYLKAYQSKMYKKEVKLMFKIIAVIQLSIFFTTIYASFQVETNSLFVKYMQCIMAVSSISITIPFLYLIKEFSRTFSVKFRVFLAGLIPFSGLGIMYLLRNCGVLNYHFGIMNSKVTLFPANTILPQLYCYGFFAFICVLLLLLFWYYKTLEEKKTEFEKLTQTSKEEFPLALINADQEVRTGLSRGLHDNVGVLLSIIKVKIGDLENENLLSPQTNNKLITKVNEVSQYVRNISNLINPSGLEYVDLASFLEDYLNELKYTGPKKNNTVISYDGLSLLKPIQGVKKNNLHRVISSIVPNKEQIRFCASYKLSVSKTEVAIYFITEISLNKHEWNFLGATKNSLEALGAIIDAYHGNLEVIELSNTSYIIEIELPTKHFY